jgi:hypothetical protein
MLRTCMFSALMILIATVQPQVAALITCSLPHFLGGNSEQLLKPVILYPASHLYGTPVLTNEDRTTESNRSQLLFKIVYSFTRKIKFQYHVYTCTVT